MTTNEGTTMTDEKTTTMTTEHEQISMTIWQLLNRLEDVAGNDLATPGHAATAQTLASALESLVTARAMLGEEPADDAEVGWAEFAAEKDGRITELEVRLLAFARMVAVRTKHGPRGSGAPGDCDDPCVKCEAVRIVDPSGSTGGAEEAPEPDDDQLTTLRRWIVERDARIRELEEAGEDLQDRIAQLVRDRDAAIDESKSRLLRAERLVAERIKELEIGNERRSFDLERRDAAIERLERESNELTVRLQLARSEPRFPGLTQEQAGMLRVAVRGWGGPDAPRLLEAIDANTAGAR